jgi:hypothetical protein
MLLDEVQPLLRLGLLKVLAEVAQSEGAAFEGRAAGVIDGPAAVTAGQSQQALQDAQASDAALVEDGLGPRSDVRPDEGGPAQEPFRAAFDAADLLGGEMPRLGAESALLVLDVDGDLLQGEVEDADQPRVPADPDASGDVLGRDGIVGLVHLHVGVAVDDALGLLEAGEGHGRQGHEGRSLLVDEARSNLMAGGAVNAGVGDGGLPPGQIPVLFGQAGEDPALERIVLGVADAALDLALVAGRAGFGGEDDGAVVAGEGLDLRVEVRVVPVGLRHRGA